MTVNVVATTFQVTALSTNNSGFDVTFDRAANLANLNLYEGGSDSLGLPDVTLTGQHVGPVQGSLVWDATTNTAHFVAYGGRLVPDTYTVDLASRSTGWTDTSGSILDGLGTNVAGSGDYVAHFTVAASSIPVLSIPSFARGPGQNVDVSDAAIGYGTALAISAGPSEQHDRGEQRRLQRRVQPDVVGHYRMQLAAGLPSDWTITTNITNVSPTTALFDVTASGTSTLSGSAADVVDLVANVPASAASVYGASQLLTLSSVHINEGNIPVTTDEAIEKAVFFGDASGDGSLSGQDASLISRNVVQLDNGFTAYPLTDPLIVADVTGDGTLSGLDASLVAQKSVSLPVPQIPDAGLISITHATVDPEVVIPVGTIGTPGGSVNVPVSIGSDIHGDAAGLNSVDITITYDPTRLSINNAGVTLSSYLSGLDWGIAKNTANSGEIIVSLFSTDDGPLPSGTPQLLNLQFSVPNNAAAGTVPVDITTTGAQKGLNEGQLIMTVSNGTVVIPLSSQIDNAARHRYRGSGDVDDDDHAAQPESLGHRSLDLQLDRHQGARPNYNHELRHGHKLELQLHA